MFLNSVQSFVIENCNGPTIENGLNNVCLHPLSRTFTCDVEPALGVSVKSVRSVAGRLEFYSLSGRTKDFKNSIRSFRARRSAQAEVRRVL